MAASSGKKKVDLRELMRQQKAAKQTSSRRIDSPLAKYNNLGQLICVVCNQQVKSEILWTAHIQGKKHKDNVVLLKTGKTAPTAVDTNPLRSDVQPRSHSTVPAKRKAETTTSQPVKGILKKPRIGLLSYEDSSSDESENETPQDKLPADFFDNSKGQSSTSKTTPSSGHSVSKVNSGSGDAIPSGLPADFFDSGATSNNGSGEPSHTDSKEDNKDQANKPMSEVLPEGFFDDPVKDAKVRKVEVRNTMEEEWEKFQKEMETQKQVSENLAEEDDEAAQTERNIDEIDEQIQCFAKVETLWDKKDEMKSKAEADRMKVGEKMQDGEEQDESGDEAEFDEFLNWRSKGAWK